MSDFEPNYHHAATRPRPKGDAIAHAAWLAIIGFAVAAIGSGIAAQIIARQGDSCTPDIVLGTTCPPVTHNYLVAYLVGAAGSVVCTLALMFIIISKAVEVGIRSARDY